MDYLSESDTSLRDISQLMRLPQCPYVNKNKEYSGKETRILDDLCDRTLKYNPEDLEKVIDKNTPKTHNQQLTSKKEVYQQPIYTDTTKIPSLVELASELGLTLPTNNYLRQTLEGEYLI